MITTVFTFLAFWITGPGSEASATPDTLQIVSSGAQNQVVVDSISVTSGNFKSDTLQLTGQIIQKGASNRIEISTASATPENNKHKNQYIHITQTGKNNSIKINSK